MFGFFTFLADHRFAAFGIIFAVGAVAARFYIPVAGKPLATVLGAISLALLCFDGGYSMRAHDDRSAELASEVVALKKNLADNAAIETAANERAATAESERAETERKVQDYETQLAKLGDCALSDDDRRRLRGLGGSPVAKPSPAARRLRTPRRSPAPVKGAKALLAEHRAALIEANRRLRADAQFYDDVRRRFGAP